jgi:hypothetical protein
VQATTDPCIPQRPRIISEALSAIIMVEALRLAEIIRHDRGIDHAQALQAMHAKLVVDHVPRAAGSPIVPHRLQLIGFSPILGQ